MSQRPTRSPLAWGELQAFLATCETGSFSGAARRLGVGHATLTRRLRTLEAGLGGPLFRLQDGRPTPTASGQALRLNLEGMATRIDEAGAAARHADDQLQGLLRLTTTDTLLQGLLAPHLRRFRAAHPGIRLQVTIQNPFLNLSRRDADVAVRGTNHPPDNLIGRLAGRIRTGPFAARGYLRTQPKPYDPKAMDWVAPDDSLAHLEQAKWLRQHIAPERIVLRMDSLVGMVEAVARGHGAGMLLCPLAARHPELVPLADPEDALDTQIWVLSHPDLRQVARVRALTRFLHDALRDDPALAH